MGKGSLFSLLRDEPRNGLQKLRADQAGNVIITFALALVPIMAATGAAVDYSHANSVKAAMQSAADSTALMLARSAATLSSSQLTQQGNDAFKALLTRPEAYGVQVSTLYSTTQGGTTTVAANGSMKTAIVGIMGFSSVNISAKAVAVVVGGGKACVLSLNSKASGATVAPGNANVKLTGCSLHDNSSNGSALTVGGSAKVSALSVGVVGGISGGAGITTTQGIATGAAPVADPYAKVSVPAFSGCTVNGFTANSTVTINPGVYCGGMQLHAKANVTLNPGVYFIDRGSFSVNGSATITGNGVTLVFTSSTMTDWPTATINGGATVNLTPPTSGPTAGIVMFGDRNMPVGTAIKFNGGASQYLGGAVYFPTGAVSFAGGAATSTSCTQLVADTISFAGNSDFAINCDGYGTKPFGPAGVRLVS